MSPEAKVRRAIFDLECRRPEHNKTWRLWHVMRVYRHFTVADLVAVLAAGDREPVSRPYIRRYLGGLIRSGHVRRQPRREGQPASYYQLVHDTGPRAPIVSSVKPRVYDPNTDTIHKLEVPHARKS